MKKTARSKMCLPMAAIMVTATLAIPAAAQAQLPFNGVFQGKDAVDAPTITTTGLVTGRLLGQFSIDQKTTLTSPAGGTGSATWVAADGQHSITSTFVASADFRTKSLGYITVTENHTITGGTGRFTGAQGSFILERTHIVALSSDGTHVTFGTFHGTITPPGAAQ